jgi:alkanesulfonate monooxygenase SsuD/methylene tetrahydromethanopterin reductase-like flavin-dependent oxidoreductase (luciferase family)
MTQFGYTAMCEQTPVRQLVSDLQAAEQAGFDFSVMSDHYFPWFEDQGHPDPAVHARAARQFTEAGFTHLALVQVGGEQQGQFIAWAEDELLPALRESAGSRGT